MVGEDFAEEEESDAIGSVTSEAAEEEAHRNRNNVESKHYEDRTNKADSPGYQEGSFPSVIVCQERDRQKAQDGSDVGRGRCQEGDQVVLTFKVVGCGYVLKLALRGRLLILFPLVLGETADELQAGRVPQEEAFGLAVVGFVAKEEDVAEHDDASDEPVEHEDGQHFLLVLACVAYSLHQVEVGLWLFVVEDDPVDFAGLRRYHGHLPYRYPN